MSKTKWLIVGIVGALVAAGLLGIGVVVIAWNVINYVPPSHLLLPKYSLDQTDSSHPWYRRTTVKLGSATYVNDFEEASLLVFAVIPTNGIARPPFGNSLACSIDGQSTNDFIAVDCGSEMEAYEVFRNVNRPPFDWRHAKFQALEIGSPTIHPERKRSTDPTLIADVVHTLSEGTSTPAAELPAALTTSHGAGALKNLVSLQMYCDELPGLVFCPSVYWDGTGTVYLAVSYSVEYTNRAEKVHGNWIPASESFTQWIKTR